MRWSLRSARLGTLRLSRDGISGSRWLFHGRIPHVGHDVVHAHAAERPAALGPLRTAPVSDEHHILKTGRYGFAGTDWVGHALALGDGAQLSVALLDPRYRIRVAARSKALLALKPGGPKVGGSCGLRYERGRAVAPAELGAVNPHAVQNHGEAPGDGDNSTPHATPLGHPHAPRFQPRPPAGVCKQQLRSLVEHGT
jgi:hypothetical protein